MTQSILHILIPVYNAASTVERTIRSLAFVLSENHERVHVWIIDDGSTDRSGKKAEEALRALAWPNFTIRCKPNGGSGSARNLALEEISSGWVLFLDADDELAADPVPLVDEAGNSSSVLCCVKVVRAGGQTSTLFPSCPEPDRFMELLSSGNPFSGPQVLFRRELLDKLFDESLRYLEDWHFWAANPRLFERCHAVPNTVLALVHAGAGNKTAHQAKNGEFRIRVADALDRLWGEQASPVTRNNLALQKAIGAVQIGQPREFKALASWPVTPTLYVKALVYLLAYKAYLRFYPYA